MTAALKTMLVDALKASAMNQTRAEFRFWGEHHEIVGVDCPYDEEPMFDLDRLATAVRDHFKNQRFEIFETVNQAVRGEITPERAADMIRLAYLTVLNEGLAAGGSEG